MMFKKLAILACSTLLFTPLCAAQTNPDESKVHKLHIGAADYKLRVTNGRPGALVAVFMGAPAKPITLPGGAAFNLGPAVLLRLRQIDSDGGSEMEFRWFGRELAPFEFWMQGISVDPDHEAEPFRTTPIIRARFNGKTGVEFFPC